MKFFNLIFYSIELNFGQTKKTIFEIFSFLLRRRRRLLLVSEPVSLLDLLRFSLPVMFDLEENNFTNKSLL